MKEKPPDETSKPVEKEESVRELEREKGFLEVSKVADFMRAQMDRNIELLETIKAGGFRTGLTFNSEIRDEIRKNVAYVNGNSNFLWQIMTNMLEQATGEKFDDLRKELSDKHWEQVQRLKGEIEGNIDNLVEQIARQKGGY